MTLGQDDAAVDAKGTGDIDAIGVVQIRGKMQAGLAVQYSRYARGAKHYSFQGRIPEWVGFLGSLRTSAPGAGETHAIPEVTILNWGRGRTKGMREGTFLQLKMLNCCPERLSSVAREITIKMLGDEGKAFLKTDGKPWSIVVRGLWIL